MTISLAGLCWPWAAQRNYLVYCWIFNVPGRGSGGVLFSSSLCTSHQWSGGVSRSKISLANFLKRFYSQIWDEGGFFSQSSKIASSHCYCSLYIPSIYISTVKEILHPTEDDPSWITEHPIVLERTEFDVSMVLSSGLWTHLNSLTQQVWITASTQSFSLLLIMQNQ